MKNLFRIFLVFPLFAFPRAFAESSKSGLDLIIEEMAHQYTSTMTREWVLQQLDHYVAKKAGEEIAKSTTSTISTSLTVINIAESLNSYNSAETEGQRYSASAHAVAAAITLAVPPAGFAAQMIVLGQDIAAAYISSEFQLKALKTIEEITSINKKISEFQLAQYNYESKSVLNLLHRAKAISELSQVAATAYSANCKKVNEEIQAPTTCLKYILTLNQLLQKEAETLGEVLTFSGRFISFYSTLSPESQKDTQEIYVAVNTKSKSLNLILEETLGQIALDRSLQIKDDVEKDLYQRKCNTATLVELKKVLTLKKEVQTSGSENSWQQDMLKEAQQDLNLLITSACGRYLQEAPLDLQGLVARALK
ncbi:MAG: hypothetical protein ACKOX6_09905 [Bdellovibrio sp.]